jgi:hypothetical protein
MIRRRATALTAEPMREERVDRSIGTPPPRVFA